MRDTEIQEEIRKLRERVDQVDDVLLRSINKRAALVHEIVSLKTESGVQLFDPKREEEILARVMERNEGPIYDASMRDIFELILHRIRDIEMQNMQGGRDRDGS